MVRVRLTPVMTSHLLKLQQNVITGIHSGIAVCIIKLNLFPSFKFRCPIAFHSSITDTTPYSCLLCPVPFSSSITFQVLWTLYTGTVPFPDSFLQKNNALFLLSKQHIGNRLASGAHISQSSLDYLHSQ